LFIYFRRIYNLKKQHRKLEMMVDHRTAQLQKQTLEILEQKNEILAQKDEILGQKDEISNQNIQLQKYGSKLEEMVYERTRELELAKNKAEESDRLKTSFLANLSHEIRTPLNAIVGFSTLIANSNPGVDPVKNWSGLVLKNNNYLLRLINDILDFAKIDSGQIEIENTKIMVSGLLSEVYETYKMKFDQKLLPLADKVDFNLCKVEGYTDIKLFSDRSLLVQVLNNLIENASKFTQKGFIEIGYKIQDNNVLFWVKDTGIGIAVENHNAIFERFRKIEDNKDALFRGTGLGLAIVKSLIEKLGGTIWVESQLGEGSTFYFTIPLKNE
jgi:signal transduction histidine kinase